MANGKDVTRTRIGVSEGAGDVTSRKQAEEVLLKAGALHLPVGIQVFPFSRLA